jgi:DNA-directed RNA polymerase I, II, and III subunit RPABC1
MNIDVQNESIDALYRSRVTLLDHLESAGYNTTPYRKFSPKEIQEMFLASPQTGPSPAFQMDLDRKEPKEGEPSKCMVVYTLGNIKQKIQKFTSLLIDPDEGSNFDVETMELIIITREAIAPNFHSTAYQFWQKEKLRVRYFQAASIINNPTKHILVPKHEKMSNEEVESMLQGNYAKKTQLPFIRFHEDPIARFLGLLPGDVVKITRPSPTAGECTLYRVCVP